MIDEKLARRAKENMGFSEYRPNSATSEYNREMEEVTQRIEAAKTKVSEEAQQRLDNLLNWYKSTYATWINKHNANGARHVSVMVAGASNYDMNGHRKYLSREGKLMGEYQQLKDIDSKISSIVYGDKIIKSSDGNALEKLKEKLQKAQEEHQGYKDYNIKARKEGKETHSTWVLSNSNQRIKAIKDRIAKLERLAATETKEIEPSKETEINGIKIIDNAEANRLQIVFDYKPDADVRTILKKHGFRWSPTQGAWQRYRGLEAERIAKELVSNL